MKKRFIIIGVIVAALIIAAFLFIARKNSASFETEPYKKSHEGAEAIYNKSAGFLKEGKLLEARQAYKELLAEYPDSEFVRKAMAELEELNMKILFSPTPTEDSVFYEVKPGDTLAKIAKEFGTTVELIMRSNNLQNTVIRPAMRLKVSKANYSVIVDKSQNILMLKAGDEILKTYTVSTGENNSTPTGTYKITTKLIDPTWYKTGAVVPPGSPENILGSRWMGLTAAGYGIHGTTDESTIGMQVTAGCIRMRNKEVEELYSILPGGAEVTIID